MTRRSLAALSPLLASVLLTLIVIGTAASCLHGGGAPTAAVGVPQPPSGNPGPSNAANPAITDGLGAFATTAGRTLLLATLVSTLSVALALPAAWSLRGRRSLSAILILTPMVLPQYLVYAAWGVARAPGTWLGDWLMTTGSGAPTSAWIWELARWTQTTLGMSLWAWPLAALVLLPSAQRIDDSTIDALRLAGAGPITRVKVVLAQLRPALLAAFALIALIMLGSAVPVHVAQIETWSIGVWRALQETGGAPSAWRAGAPLMLITGTAGAFMAWRLVRSGRNEDSPDEPADIRRSAPAWPMALVWSLSVLLPAALLATHLKQFSSLGRFWAESAEPLWFSVQVGFAVGAFTVLIAFSTALGLSGTARGTTARLTVLTVATWAALAAVPGILVGSALLSSSTQLPFAGWLSDSSAGLIAAHVARFGVVGALAGWWAARSEPRTLRDTRLMLGDSLRGWWMGVGFPAIGVLSCAGLAAGMLSVHEIEAGVVVSPPGVRTLSQHMLNLLHYLRDEQLTAGSLWMLGLGAAAAGIGLVMLRGSITLRAASRVTPTILLVLTLAVTMHGCAPVSQDPTNTTPLPGATVLGEPGKAPGQYVKPRCIDTDGERLFVIDMTGRCQVISPKGEALTWWTMPAIDRGKPTGVTWFPGFAKGTSTGIGGVTGPMVLVADSHENRLAAYALPTDPRAHPGSQEIPIALQWGGYGHEPGKFIFTSDVLVVEGTGNQPTRVYVSEYGGNDRVTIFDTTGQVLSTFGEEGDSESPAPVQFRRPQSLLWDAPSQTLVIADACNHRLGLFTAEGVLKKWIGRPGALPGQALGEFHYPYGLTQLPDGTVLVAEQGNARVQRVDVRAGKGLAIYGKRGRGVGELDAPWGIASIGDTAFICDAGNHRLQSFVVPPISGYPWPEVAMVSIHPVTEVSRK